MRKLTMKDWFLATRPWSYPVSACPAVVAFLYTLWAHPGSSSRWWLGVLAVLGAVIFHSGGNLISDYHDFRTGVDKPGNPGATTLTSGLFKPKQILYYGAAYLVLGVALSAILLRFSGTGILLVLAIGLLGSIFYYLLKAHALGDLLIFIIFGPAITLGVSYTMLSYYDWRLFAVALPLAFITVNVLHSNNTRDIERDSEVGVTTFAKLLGVKMSVFYYCLLTALSYATLALMAVFSMLPLWTALSLLTLPLAFKNCKTMTKAKSKDLSPITDLDKNTAGLQLAFSMSALLGLTLALVL